MNENILDDIYSDDLRGLLQKDETVIWEGKPKTGVNQIINTIIRLSLIFMIFSQWYKENYALSIMFVILLITELFHELKQFQKRKNTRYLITNQQVLFQLLEKGKKQFHSIPIEDIKAINMQPEFGNTGVIFLELNESTTVDFKTTNLIRSGQRVFPTLELIEDPHKIEALINGEIKNLDKSN